MLHTKGARGWMRALVIVMVSLSLTLSMPAKPAMALITVPTIDVQGVPLWIKQLAEQVATKLINMAMQKLMEEANKALGPVVNMPILGEFVGVVMDGMAQDLAYMAYRGSNDALAGIFRSPQKNFQDCMGSATCSSSVQMNNISASFKTGDYADAFTATPPSALPAAMKGAFQYGDVAGVANTKIDLAGPATQDGSNANIWTGVTTGGAEVTFPYSGSTPPYSIAAGTKFFTPDATVNTDNLTNLNLNVGNGALTIANVSLDGSNPYTVAASPAVRTAIEQANKTGVPQNVAGMTIAPGRLGVGSNGQITGDIATLNFGNADATVAFGSQGSPQIRANVGNALCPDLTEQDKAGGKVCGAANAAISGLVGCVSGGNAGNCAQDVGKNVAQQLLGGVGQALGGALKGGGKSSGGLQVEAGQQALFAQYFCPPNDNTPQCMAQKSADRNAAVAYSTTAYIANAKAWQVKFPQIKADCDKAVAKATKNGDSNSLQAGKIIQIQCYNGMDVAYKNLELERSIVDMYGIIATAPTAIPGGGG
jgi:hypothetical protein